MQHCRWSHLSQSVNQLQIIWLHKSRIIATTSTGDFSDNLHKGCHRTEQSKKMFVYINLIWIFMEVFKSRLSIHPRLCHDSKHPIQERAPGEYCNNMNKSLGFRYLN